MFIGHFAVGFAAKPLAPRASLGTLMTAPLLLDLLWPVFLLLGFEQVRIVPGDSAFLTLDLYHYPWSHSLLMSVVWGALFALLYRARTNYMRGAVVVALGVVSHWVLDYVTHRPDMPLVPGVGIKLGLGLWNSVPATIAVEVAMFGSGLGFYLRTTRAKDRVGSFALGAFVVLLLLLYIANAFGPPPPSAEMLRRVGLVVWLFVPWVYWIDRHRELRAAA